jgi:hypothetical protein
MRLLLPILLLFELHQHQLYISKFGWLRPQRHLQLPLLEPLLYRLLLAF